MLKHVMPHWEHTIVAGYLSYVENCQYGKNRELAEEYFQMLSYDELCVLEKYFFIGKFFYRDRENGTRGKIVDSVAYGVDDLNDVVCHNNIHTAREQLVKYLLCKSNVLWYMTVINECVHDEYLEAVRNALGGEK